MSRIRSRDTGPEILVRSVLHRLGCRFGLYRKDLPGKPDIVLPKFRTVFDVRGCYFHRHRGCRNCTTPSTNTEFWKKKFHENVVRDRRNERALKKLGWRIIIVWECEAADVQRLRRRLATVVAKIRASSSGEPQPR